MKPKLGDNEAEALFMAINEALVRHGRTMEPVDAETLLPELAKDAEVRRCLRAFGELERAMKRLDRRVARLLGARAKTMGQTFEEAYPELFAGRRKSA